jgi:hypothetical protein
VTEKARTGISRDVHLRLSDFTIDFENADPFSPAVRFQESWFDRYRPNEDAQLENLAAREQPFVQQRLFAGATCLAHRLPERFDKVAQPAR